MPKNAIQKRIYNAATVSFVSGASGTSGGSTGNADTVDGFHASATATANTLYPLGAGARYAATVLPTDTAYYDAIQTWSAVQTFSSGMLYAANIGPALGQLHTLPAVTSDTVALLAASQALTGKTYNGLTLTATTGTFTLTNGKTFSVANTLSLSGTDSKSLTLTGSLSVGADTTITGGGTIALGGFTLTVPATGTAVLTSRSLTAGNGLTGGGDLSADRTIDVGAGNGISVAADAVAVNTSYAFTWLALHSFDAGAQISAGQSLGFSPDVTLSRKSADVLQLGAGDNLQTPTFTSGYVGWNLDADGNAEFNNVVMRGEMRASVFSVGEIHATGGSLLVLPAYLVYEDATSM